jgi:hypothetical protein
LSGRTGAGKHITELKCGILPDIIDTTKVIINNITSEMSLQLVVSSSDGIKLMPNIKIIDISTPVFDLNVTFSSSILDKIAKAANDKIKDYIQSFSKIILDADLEAFVNYIILDIYPGLPVYYSISTLYPNYAHDMSIASEIQFKGNMLVDNLNGALVNLNNSETMVSPYPFDSNLPDIDQNGTDFQLYLSEYYFNTAFYTLYKSNAFNIMLTKDNAPPDIKLNTTWLDGYFLGLINAYGKDKEVRVWFYMNDLPVNIINLDKTITINFELYTTWMAQLDSSFDTFLSYSSNFTLIVKNIINDDGRGTLKLAGCYQGDFQVHEHYIDLYDETVNFIEEVFQDALPYYDSLIQDLIAKFPLIDGYEVDDLDIRFNNGFVKIEANPKKRVYDRRKFEFLE